MLGSPSSFRVSISAVLSLASLLLPGFASGQTPSGQPTKPTAVPPSPCPTNRAPRFVRVLPDRFDSPSASVKVGVPIELTLVAEDPDGDPLEMRALALPDGATFSAELGKMTWTPSLEQIGNHAIGFQVSDGHKQDKKVLLLEVRENQPPVFFPRQYRLSVGQFGHLAFVAEDADGDSLTYAIERLPTGASFDAGQGVLHWQPQLDAVGAHQLEVTVSDGATSVSHTFTLQVLPASEDAWAAFLRPRIAATLYRPPPSTRIGTFVGAGAYLSLVSWMHHTESPGPSHGGVYLGLESMASTDSEVMSMFSYLGGFYLSFERNANRRWLIPLYGMELGGFVQQQLGSPFHFTPFGGVQLFADRTLAVALRAGYRAVPARPSRLSGLHAAFALDWFDW